MILEIPQSIKQRLLAEALVRTGDEIFPCGNKESLEECFTIALGNAYFWYNDKSGNTLIVKQPLTSAGVAN